VGKSTLAQTIAQEAAGAAKRLDYLDLENPADQAKRRTLASICARADRLVVIDEEGLEAIGLRDLANGRV
jgi:hypothetical protein